MFLLPFFSSCVLWVSSHLFFFDYIYIDSALRLNLTKFLLINNNLICFLKILIITLFLFIFVLLFSLLHLPILFDIISYHLFNFASCSFLIIWSYFSLFFDISCFVLFWQKLNYFLKTNRSISLSLPIEKCQITRFSKIFHITFWSCYGINFRLCNESGWVVAINSCV